MDDTPQAPAGFLTPIRQFLRTAWALAQARLELFLLEAREERLRLFDALLLMAICLVCVLMTLALLTATLVVIFWDEHRVLVLVLATLAYAAGAGVSLWTLRKRHRQWQSFAATLEQVRKDRACLEKQS